MEKLGYEIVDLETNILLCTKLVNDILEQKELKNTKARLQDYLGKH